MKIRIFNKLGTNDALLFSRNLAMTLGAGIPLARALKLFEDDANRKRKPLLRHLRGSVEQGHTLAEAMETAPKQFPSIAVNLVKAGEMGGTLEASLDAIVKHLKRIKELKRKIRSAMMYPTFVLIATLGLGISVGTLVLPKLIPLFESLDITLPWTTRLLLWIANFLDLYGITLAVSFVSFLIAFYIVTRIEVVKPYWHRLLLMMPYIGQVQRQAAAAQITETLSTLLKSGVPISEAIPAASETTENRVFRAALNDCVPVIKGGRTFADGLGKSKNVFPSMTKTMVEIGEETGTLTETLAYLSEYFETEVDYAVKNLTNALEPILLIAVGLIVGGVVLSIITPIYEVTSSIR